MGQLSSAGEVSVCFCEGHSSLHYASLCHSYRSADLLLPLVLSQAHLEGPEALQFKLLRVQAALSLLQFSTQMLHLQAALPVLPLLLQQRPLRLEIK